MIYFDDYKKEKKFMGKYEVDSLTLDDFLMAIDSNYQNEVNTIDLFNPNLKKKWTQEQKTLFVQLFYHARGHFYKFLWHVGTLAQDPELKKNVLHNIAEEFGEKGKSHEQMYLDFAKSLNVDLIKEIYEEKFYLNFLRDFDMNHVKLIIQSDDAGRFLLFSAYERLDNIDYTNLLKLVESLGVTDDAGLLFFIVHSHAEHFDRLYQYLDNIWKHQEKKEDVICAFEFIYGNQLTMWKQLSAAIYTTG